MQNQGTHLSAWTFSLKSCERSLQIQKQNRYKYRKQNFAITSLWFKKKYLSTTFPQFA